MKTVFLTALLFLTSCSFLLIPHFDAQEYGELIDIAAYASRSSCEQSRLEELSKLSNHLVYYVTYLPHNELMAKGVVEMDKTVQELIARSHQQPFSYTYCNLQLRSITLMATILAQASGTKLR